MIKVLCPSCKKAHQAPESILGRRVKCKDCGETFVAQSDVPSSGMPPTAASILADFEAKRAATKGPDRSANAPQGDPPKVPADQAQQPWWATASPKPQQKPLIGQVPPQAAQTNRSGESLGLVSLPEGKKFPVIWIVGGLLLVVVILAAILGRGGGAILMDRPSEEDGKGAILKIISESDTAGAIKLLSARKTNGQDAEVSGVKTYTMEVECEIEFTKFCGWDPLYGSGSFMTTLQQAGGYAPTNSGERKKVNCKLTFEKAENGWRYKNYEYFKPN
jgi:hypothetical protein